VPPPAEQRRIANKLDTLLTRVDACRDRLARVTPMLKRFRQSVLAAATSGRLTEEWRLSGHCAGTGSDVLLQLQQDHAIAGGHARGNASAPTDEAHDLNVDDLPENWCVLTLRDACEPGRPITYGILKPGPELTDGVPYIRVADFPGNRLRLDSIKKTSHEIDDQFKRARLRPGDLLLSIRGSVGRIVEIPESLANANITQDTARLTISRRIDSQYVAISRQDESTQRRMRTATRGVAVRGINIGDVRALQVPLPPRGEQTEIVRRVETLFAFADRLEARLAAAQTAADRLTPALLAKAFRGELVPQDPDDEPAAELLTRIRAQRDQSQRPAPRKRRSRTPA
jgi:type I restriction enzyme S subunit